MTLYRQAMRQQVVSLAIWAAVFFALMLAVVPAARAIVRSGLMGSFLLALPPYLRTLFGGRLMAVQPLDAYLYAKVFFYFPLLVGIYAALQAAAMVARDVERRRFDFLLGLPVSRARVVLARLWSVLTAVGVLWGVMLLALAVLLPAQGLAGDWAGYWLVALSGFLVDAALAAAALWVSSAAAGYRGAVRVALAVAYVPFMYDFALRLAQVPSGWLLALPYGYFDPPRLFLTHAFPWLATLVLLLATAAFAALSVQAFERREV